MRQGVFPKLQLRLHKSSGPVSENPRLRKNLHVKILKHRVVLLNVIDVGFIAIGDQNQWVTLAEILEKGFGDQKVREEYGRPGFVEIREVHLKLAGFAEIPV